MELHVNIAKPSSIVRKLTIKVPADVVKNRFERGMVEVQRTAKLKGFRPGYAPISLIRQYYGDDVRQRVYDNLINDSFNQAVHDNKVAAVGSPKIETSGANLQDVEKDFTFVATVEVLPEIEPKGYEGMSLARDVVEVSLKDVDNFINSLRESHAELIPSSVDDLAKTGSFVDIAFSGKIVAESGELRNMDGLGGSRVLEIGSKAFIEGFEENLIGMKAGEKRTFRLDFPKDYKNSEFAGKKAEFEVALNEIKTKKLPELDDEFAKQMSCENIQDLKSKVESRLAGERNADADRKLRSELVQKLIEKNSFDVPVALVESEMRSLAENLAGELKQKGIDERTISEFLKKDIDSLRKRAENQVRATLILNAIANKENVEVTPANYEEEVGKLAASMNIEVQKLTEFYAKNSDRKDDFVFRVRQDRTVRLLLDKAKIKSKS
ncbi:MAG: trigger factor [Bdellovibrionota bacterium]